MFGVVCAFFGYRCFKAIMFLYGFIFGSIVVYLICVEEKVLPDWSNAAIAMSAGLLFGLITMLVQYVGLFMLGFHTGENGIVPPEKCSIKKIRENTLFDDPIRNTYNN